MQPKGEELLPKTKSLKACVREALLFLAGAAIECGHLDGRGAVMILGFLECFPSHGTTQIMGGVHLHCVLSTSSLLSLALNLS